MSKTELRVGAKLGAFTQNVKVLSHFLTAPFIQQNFNSKTSAMRWTSKPHPPPLFLYPDWNFKFDIGNYSVDHNTQRTYGTQANLLKSYKLNKRNENGQIENLNYVFELRILDPKRILWSRLNNSCKLFMIKCLRIDLNLIFAVSLRHNAAIIAIIHGYLEIINENVSSAISTQKLYYIVYNRIYRLVFPWLYFYL